MEMWWNTVEFGNAWWIGGFVIYTIVFAVLSIWLVYTANTMVMCMARITLLTLIVAFSVFLWPLMVFIGGVFVVFGFLLWLLTLAIDD